MNILLDVMVVAIDSITILIQRREREKIKVESKKNGN